jgi:hypothetical protein
MRVVAITQRGVRRAFPLALVALGACASGGRFGSGGDYSAPCARGRMVVTARVEAREGRCVSLRVQRVVSVADSERLSPPDGGVELLNSLQEGMAITGVALADDVLQGDVVAAIFEPRASAPIGLELYPLEGDDRVAAHWGPNSLSLDEIVDRECDSKLASLRPSDRGTQTSGTIPIGPPEPVGDCGSLSTSQ